MSFPVGIFDYNGVLVDDEAVHLAAFRDVLAPLGIEVGEKDYWDRYIGFDDREGFGAMLQDAGQTATPAVIDRLVTGKRPCYLERARRDLQSFPGAAELVRRQAERGPVVIVSGALRDEIRLGLDWLGIASCVSHVVAAEDTRLSKPDPEGYLLALAWLKVQGVQQPLRNAYVVEDSLAGIVAAKAAGLPCIAVAHSYSRDKLQTANPDLILDRIGELDEATLAAFYLRACG